MQGSFWGGRGAKGTRHGNSNHCCPVRPFPTLHTCLSLHLWFKCPLNTGEQKCIWSEPQTLHPATNSCLCCRFPLGPRGNVIRCLLRHTAGGGEGGEEAWPSYCQLIHPSFLQFMNSLPIAKVPVISLQGHDFALWIIKFHAVSILLFHKVIWFFLHNNQAFLGLY